MLLSVMHLASVFSKYKHLSCTRSRDWFVLSPNCIHCRSLGARQRRFFGRQWRLPDQQTNLKGEDTRHPCEPVPVCSQASTRVYAPCIGILLSPTILHLVLSLSMCGHFVAFKRSETAASDSCVRRKSEDTLVSSSDIWVKTIWYLIEITSKK